MNIEFKNALKKLAIYENDVNVLISYHDLLTKYNIKKTINVPLDVIKIIIKYTVPKKIGLFFVEYNIDRMMHFVYDLKNYTASNSTINFICSMFPNVCLPHLNVCRWNFPDGFDNLPCNVLHFVVENFQIMDFLPKISDEIKKRMMSIYFVSDINVYSECLDEIHECDELINCVNLEKIRFRNVGNSFIFLRYFFEALSGCSNLKRLSVGRIMMVKKCYGGKITLQNRSLRSLRVVSYVFSDFEIQKGRIMQFQILLDECPNLRRLEISNNFMAKMLNLQKLRYLKIYNSGIGVLDFAPLIGCGNLKYLDISEFAKCGDMKNLHILKCLRLGVVIVSSRLKPSDLGVFFDLDVVIKQC